MSSGWLISLKPLSSRHWESPGKTPWLTCPTSPATFQLQLGQSYNFCQVHHLFFPFPIWGTFSLFFSTHLNPICLLRHRSNYTSSRKCFRDNPTPNDLSTHVSYSPIILGMCFSFPQGGPAAPMQIIFWIFLQSQHSGRCWILERTAKVWDELVQRVLKYCPECFWNQSHSQTKSSEWTW